MVKIFVDFLRSYFNFEQKKIRFSVLGYADSFDTEEAVKSHWLELLKLPLECLSKCRFVNKANTGKWPYGAGRIEYYDVTVLQEIYGAIEEYASVKEQRWL